MSLTISLHEVAERLIARSRPAENGCREWAFCKASNGYGRLALKGAGTQSAHRISYECFVGPIPNGLVIDHLCRNRACINPAHLEPVEFIENIRRGVVGERSRSRQLAKTHCPKGHPYSGSNLRIKHSPGRAPSRNCRACERARKKGMKHVDI